MAHFSSHKRGHLYCFSDVYRSISSVSQTIRDYCIVFLCSDWSTMVHYSFGFVLLWFYCPVSLEDPIYFTVLRWVWGFIYYWRPGLLWLNVICCRMNFYTYNENNKPITIYILVFTIYMVIADRVCNIWTNEWMNGVLDHEPALVRLYWAGDNMGVIFEQLKG